MVKRSFICAVLMFFLFSVAVYARPIPCVEAEGSNTLLGVFDTAGLDKQQKDFMRQWVSSPRNICIHSTGSKIFFVIVPDGVNVDFTRTGNNYPQLVHTGTLQYMSFDCPALGSQPLKFSAYGTLSAGSSVETLVLISGTYFSTTGFNPPILSYDYLPEYDGNLILRDNSNIFAGGGDTGESGILQWLSDFWETFKKTMKDLFVPEDAYFDSWYREVKAAADKKFGSIFDLYETIKDAFQQMNDDSTQTSSLIWRIPADQLWSGSPEINGDILKSALPYLKHIKNWLTIIFVIFTAIACYHRLVVLFEQ